MNPILVTPRLLLRAMSMDDLEFVASMLADPDVMRYYPKLLSRAEAEAWVGRQLDRYARHGHGLWLVVDRADGQPVGQVGLILQRVESVELLEIGYLIHRPFWRRGIATEAATATRDHAFNDLGKSRVFSLIRPENLPSQGVARKLGMVSEGRTVIHGGFEHLVFSVERPDRSGQGLVSPVAGGGEDRPERLS
jgi:ribosomal-protein-alanine N-acetyltransferase